MTAVIFRSRRFDIGAPSIFLHPATEIEALTYLLEQLERAENYELAAVAYEWLQAARKRQTETILNYDKNRGQQTDNRN